MNPGWLRIYCQDLLSVLLQEWLCAAAAIRLTSLGLHQPPGITARAPYTQVTGTQTNLNTGISFSFTLNVTLAVYCSTITKQSNKKKKNTKCNVIWLTLAFLVIGEAKKTAEKRRPRPFSSGPLM